MVNRSKDEPDDKAYERLKQMEDARKPVPDKASEQQEQERQEPVSPTADPCNPPQQKTPKSSS